MVSAVSLTGVTKSFSEGDVERLVLQDLELQVVRGETVALLGSSGSGKSTLLNVLAGLILPDRGQVEVDGVLLGSLDDHQRTLFRRRSIGFIFQFFHLIPTLTVAENVLLPLQLLEVDHGCESRERVEFLLQRMGLFERRDTLPDRLSGGEQQRVAVARALVHEPSVVLADEPTGNLDRATAEVILHLILELCEEFRSTLMLVTHSRSVARQCQRTFQLSEGVLSLVEP